LEIITSILRLCKNEGATKTRIVYHANLNFKVAGVYLDWLTNHQLLAKENTHYKTTEAGVSLLATSQEIVSLINEELKHKN
jgi:predicted transcriptional regulator